MTARQQARLMLALGLAAALAGAASAWIGRGVEPAAGSLLGEGASHVVWGLAASLVQLLAQSWIALFGIGSLRLLGARGVRPDGARAWALVAGPLVVMALHAGAVASGIHSYSSALPSRGHAALGWALAVAPFVVLAWEGRTLERIDLAMSEADRAETRAGG